MNQDDEQIALKSADTLPKAQRQPNCRSCHYCGRRQVLSGYFDHGGNRHWIYLPGECNCGKTETITERIKQ